ncbi:terminase small subunit [Mucilaginibacter litoreus]|uniref:Terminase small subunit n=1 Tax=Mucilaginibacter litoreus TaxID=1048221 RepID=A0ABW3APL2_9SPHI
MVSLLKTRPYGVRIAKYFDFIKGTPAISSLDTKETGGKTLNKQDREPQPPTLAGLALFLGFDSREQFEHYERNGRFRNQLKMGRLMIEAEYEKRLHQQSATGAIFALKSLGWKEPADDTLKKAFPATIHIKVTASGPKIATHEKDVEL